MGLGIFQLTMDDNFDVTERIQTFVEDNESLHAAPTILTELQELFSDQDVDIDEVVRLVSQDPTLALKVLKKANSTFFARSNGVVDIFEAITCLGLYEVFCIINTLVTEEAIFNNNQAGGFSMYTLWRHAVSTAVICEALATRDEKFKVTAYTAGLLHDVGKIIMANTGSTEYQECLTKRNYLKGDTTELETEHFGFSHAQLGAHIASNWGLPDFVHNAIQYHHQYFEENSEFIIDYELYSVIKMANIVAHYLEKPQIGIQYVIETGEDQMKYLDLDISTLSRTILTSRDVLDKIEALI